MDEVREFVLSEGRTEQLRAEVDKLNRRAAKLGVPAVEITVKEIDPRPYPGHCNVCSSQGRIWCPEHADKLYAAFSVTLKNPVVTISDYSVSARLDHTEGLVISLRDGYAAKYKDAAPVCEHCHENRRRNVTYILTDANGNDIQVGSTCLKDFSGAYDAERIAAMLTHYYDLCSDLESDDGEGWDGSSGDRRINTRNYLAATNVAIRLGGWSPKSAYGTPTATIAYSILYPPTTEKNPPEITAEDYERADAAIAWALTECESTNDYLLTISNLADKEYFAPRYDGYVASIIAAYDRAENRKVEMAIREKAKSEILPEILAPVGTRVRDIPVTVTNKRHFDTDYGVSTLYNMRTESNHSLSWFASNDPGFDIGDTATLTGTVKAYDEKYNSTKLSRCKLT